VVVLGGTFVGGLAVGGIGAFLGSAVPFGLPAASLLTTMASVAAAGMAGACGVRGHGSACTAPHEAPSVL